QNNENAETIIFLFMMPSVECFFFNSHDIDAMAALYFGIVISFLSFYQPVFAHPPKLTPFVDHIDLVENQTYVLACSLRSGSHITFEWTHSNAKLTSDSDISIETSSKFSVLTFKNAKRQHSGEY